MNNTRNNAPVIVIILVVLLLIGVAVYAWTRNDDAEDIVNVNNNSEGEEQMVERSLYQNPTYGFSFDVPVGYSFVENGPESVSVGQQRGLGFDSSANASVVSSEDTDAFEDYNAFLEDSILAMCAADGPTETVRCTEVARSQPFTSGNGVSGTEFYLTEETATTGVGATTTTIEKGPFFAFDLSGQTEDETMTALIIHAPMATPENLVNTTLVRSVASSVQIHSLDNQ